jgi:hypothetical protein
MRQSSREHWTSNRSALMGFRVAPLAHSTPHGSNRLAHTAAFRVLGTLIWYESRSLADEPVKRACGHPKGALSILHAQIHIKAGDAPT